MELPRRCSCGVHRYERCPDRAQHHRDDLMPPVFAWVSLLVLLVLIGVGMTGLAKLLELW